MALQTPKHRATGLQRPSIGHLNTSSSPNLKASTTDINRKASLQALTGQVPTTPNGRMDAELEVGDAVNVPGDMHGVVKFIGSVRGKSGRFVGVELDRRFATRGKNDGDVDGINYFETTVPGAGIFLPVHRAEKRFSPAASDTFSATPTTPSYSTLNGKRVNGIDAYSATTPAIKPKFSQTVGPGARPPSPSFKPKRPSLPRPESPLRKQPTLAPTPARGFSQSVAGTRPSQTPIKSSFKSSTTSRPPIPNTTARPYSRNGSRLGNREEDGKNGRNSSLGQSVRPASRQGSASHETEVHRLKAQLAERDQRLNEQAASLAEMETSVKELSALLAPDGPSRMDSFSDDEDKTVVQLRQMLREKNEKISKLTAEFDAHRADFRSTLDSLEMASTETERVYEEQKRDLLAQLAEMQDSGQSKEDFEGVAQQLKQLEELVAELEEGLEESRRGEAEARGEVEFLRGEVERGRSELRREREKAAAAMKHASVTSNGSSIKDLEQRDDEIRGLKAIIHSLSEGSSVATTNPTSVSSVDEEELKRLQTALEKSQHEKESLENELEQVRRDREHTTGTVHARNESEMTERALPNRPRSNTIKPVTPLFEGRATKAADAVENKASPTGVAYCEMCESADHDTLDCTKLGGGGAAAHAPSSQQHAATTYHAPLDVGKDKHIVGAGADSNTTKADAQGHAGSEKWCALCEKDGHLAFDCPEEQY